MINEMRRTPERPKARQMNSEKPGATKADPPQGGAKGELLSIREVASIIQPNVFTS